MAVKRGSIKSFGRDGQGRRPYSKVRLRKIVSDSVAKAAKAGRLFTDEDFEHLKQSDPTMLNGNIDRTKKEMLARRELRRRGRVYKLSKGKR